MQAPINAHSNWLNKYGITPREAQILELILQGIDSNQEIAEKLADSRQRTASTGQRLPAVGITVSTVKFHVHMICVRLNVRSKLEIAVKYYKEASQAQ